jgi:hypothetical protein
MEIINFHQVLYRYLQGALSKATGRLAPNAHHGCKEKLSGVEKLGEE